MQPQAKLAATVDAFEFSWFFLIDERVEVSYSLSLCGLNLFCRQVGNLLSEAENAVTIAAQRGLLFLLRILSLVFPWRQKTIHPLRKHLVVRLNRVKVVKTQLMPQGRALVQGNAISRIIFRFDFQK